jgi:uncharacterized protein
MPPLDPALALLREAFPDLAAVYLFGSTAGEATTPESDVDLAVLAARPLDPVARFDLQERLALALGRDVDLVDLRAASTVMQAQVVAHGRAVLDLDPRERAAFEMVTLSAYALLNEERAGILADIQARGRVHA